MNWLDWTAPTLAENLAWDEVFLGLVGRCELPDMVRVWEPSSFGVVLGRASRVDTEVNLAACQRDQIPLARRVSGGCAVVCGPGCLMYSVVVHRAGQPQLATPDRAHAWFLRQLAAALTSPQMPVACQGTSDLTVGPHKFSGNSMRMQRDAVLYHGTLLYDFPLPILATYLKMPPREPDYRQSRSHVDFVANLGLSATELRQHVRTAYRCEQVLSEQQLSLWQPTVTQLVRERYEDSAWTLQW